MGPVLLLPMRSASEAIRIRRHARLAASAAGGGGLRRRVWLALAALVAVRAGVAPAQAQDELLQLLSVTLQRRLASEEAVRETLPGC